MAGSWAFASHAFGGVAEGVSAVRQYNPLQRLVSHAGLDFQRGAARRGENRFFPALGSVARFAASEYLGDRVSRFVHNQGMQGGWFFNWPGSSAMWRRLGNRSGSAVRAYVESRGRSYPTRTPFVRHPRMFARPVPAWQLRFGAFGRSGRRRRVGRHELYLNPNSWRNEFRQF